MPMPRLAGRCAIQRRRSGELQKRGEKPNVRTGSEQMLRVEAASRAEGGVLWRGEDSRDREKVSELACGSQRESQTQAECRRAIEETTTLQATVVARQRRQCTQASTAVRRRDVIAVGHLQRCAALCITCCAVC